MSAQSGTSLLYKLHLRLFSRRPAIDVLMIFLLAVISATVSIGLVLYSSIESAFQRSGQENTILITSRNANSESESFIQLEEANLLKAVLSESALLDQLSIDSQLIMSTSVAVDDEVMYIGLRGIAPDNFDLGKYELVEGEMFLPGLNEVIVGRNIMEEAEGFQLGDTVQLAQKEWKIIGVYDMQGDVRENELVGDLVQIQHRYGAGDLINTIRLRGDQTVLEEASVAINESDLDFVAQWEKEFFENQSKSVVERVLGIQIVIVLLVVPAALAGMMSIQKIQVRNLAKELNTLYLFGYQVKTIALSMLVRTLGVALIASVLAAIAIFFLVANLTIELDLGLQSTYVQFNPDLLNFIVIFVVAVGIALVSNLLTPIAKQISEPLK